MSNPLNGCLLQKPSNSTYSDIAACQNTSTTPFCWPTNNTRICVPGSFQIYWARNFFKPGSQLTIELSKGSRTYQLGNQTGNFSIDATLSTFWYNADPILGKTDERVMTILMRETWNASNTDSTNLQAKYVGPTVTLVDTSYVPRPSTSSKPVSDNSDSDILDLSKGAMTGIVLGILVGVVALITLCCCCGWCACCGGKSRQKSKIDRNMHATIVEEGTVLMELPKAPGQPTPRVIEEARLTQDRGEVEAPPPKYTP